MVRMAINNFHPDSVNISVIAYTLDKILVSILKGTGVVVPHKISELEYVVHSEVIKCFKDYYPDSGEVQTDLIFDQDLVVTRISRQTSQRLEELFSITADRWNA
ncbi:MAG: hypothetical protein VR68_13355 [Peptococcaceae bacterium BRH_c4a]|nr:MAG: hypothetical protein VR68_13355 [Peptococcaceae bacterium BRH_c4a]